MKIILGVLLAATVVSAQDDPKVSLNGVTLQQLAESVQRRTKKTFLYSEAVAQQLATLKVRVFSAREFSDANELFAVFQTLLQANKFTLGTVGAPGEGKYTISLQTEASKWAATQGDGCVMRIFQLQNITTTEATQVLSAIAPLGTLTPVPNTGLILVADTEPNMKRYEEILKAIDLKKPDLIWQKITLRKAMAADVEATMTALLGAVTGQQKFRTGMPMAGTEPVKVVGDKRTNSILVVAEPSRIEQIVTMIHELDGDAEFETSEIHFIPVKHRDPVSLAETLNKLFRGDADAGRSKAGVPSTPVPGAPNGAPTSASPGTIPMVVADRETGMLMVTSDRNTYRLIRKTAERLDQRRPQVLIKASVVEVQANASFDLGAELNRLLDPRGGSTVGVRSSTGYSQLLPDGTIAPLDTPGLSLALFHDRIGNVAALFKAFEDKARISILDEPEVATVDNQNATITISTAVPVLNTSLTGTGISQQGFITQTAETTLSISPHISEGGYLRLDTLITIEKFTGASGDPRLPPVKTKREIKTPINIRNGRTVVIGGIVTTDHLEQDQGTPILQDLPLVGGLFHRKHSTEVKRTLYIFITPYVMNDESFSDMGRLTREREEEMAKLRGGRPLVNLNTAEPQPPKMVSTFRFVKPSEGPDNR